MDGLHVFSLRARSGRERTDLWWLPSDAWLQDFYDKAAKRGLTVTENESTNPKDDKDYEQIR